MTEETNRRHLLQMLAGGGLFLNLTQPVGATDNYVDAQTIDWSDPQELGDAIATESIEDAIVDIEYRGEPAQAEIFTDELQHFPLDIDEPNDRYLVLSSGHAADAPGDPTEFSSTNLNGRSFPNYSPDEFDAFNVAELRIDIHVPDDAVGVALDYRFGTEENPEFLGANFQDFFEAPYLRQNVEPSNIARLPNGEPVTVDNANDYANSPGGTSQDPTPPFPDPPDVTYNSVTELQTASASVVGAQGEVVRLILRIGDATDGVYDSAVFLDNLRFTDDVTVSLNEVETALQQYRSAVSEGIQTSAWMLADRDRRLYDEYGEEFAEDVIAHFQYLAGDLDAADMEPEVVDALDAVADDLTADQAASLAAFYQDLFALGQPASVTTEEFFAHYWTAYEIHGPDGDEMATFESLHETFLDTFDDRRGEFMANTEGGTFDAADIDDIITYLTGRTDEVVESTNETVAEFERTTEVLLEGDGLGGYIEDYSMPSMDPDEAGGNGIVLPAIKLTIWFLTHTPAGKAVVSTGSSIKSSVGSWLSAQAASHGISLPVGVTAAAGSAFYATKKTVAYLVSLSHTNIGTIIHTADAMLAAWKLGFRSGRLVGDTYLDQRTQSPELGIDTPEEAIAVVNRDARIVELSVPNITIDDAIPSDDGLVGQGTGTLVVENTGETTFAPVPQLRIWANTLLGSASGDRTRFITTVTEPVPPIAPGEQTTVEFTYVVPINFIPTTFTMVASITGIGTTATEEFSAGMTEPVGVEQETLMEGTLADGESTRTDHSPTNDPMTLGYELEYSQYDVDLHLFDHLGNHTGMNYETNQFETEVPNATHSGHDDGTAGQESVTIVNPQSDSYSIELVASEIDTIIQSEGSDNFESTSQPQFGAGGGNMAGPHLSSVSGINIEYSTTATSVPALPPTLAIGPRHSPPTVEDEPTVTIEMEAAERGGHADATGMTVEASALESPETDVKIDDVEPHVDMIDVEAGRSTQFDVDVTIPRSIPPGRYTGSVTLSNGEVHAEGPLQIDVDGEPPSDGVLLGLDTEEVLVLGAVGLGTLYLILHHQSDTDGD